MRIAVIGTAGRRDDREKLSWALYGKAYNKLDAILSETGLPPEQIHLVSGGAAWMDHEAVTLYLTGKASSLTIFGAAPWDAENSEWYDSGVRDFKTNPGGTLNHYHRLFHEDTGRNSLATLGRVFASGAKLIVKPGLHNRNRHVATECDMAIALTFNDSTVPKDGGTKHTWDIAKSLEKQCIHIDLGSL